MTNQQHTPAPWTLFDGKSSSLNGKQIVFGSEKPAEWNTIDLETGKREPDNALCGETIAVVYEDTEKFGEWTPNARLIAAAPELLDALIMFVAQYEGNGKDSREERPEMIAARAAIAKSVA